MLPTRTGPEPIDDQLQQDRRHLELKQRRDGMWSLQGRLTNTVGAQLNAILDPLAKHRTSSIEDEDGNIIQIPDARPSGQRLHDALDEACGRLLKSADQPLAGGVPASVIITVQLADLLAKAGLAETNDGTMLTAEQLLRIADEAEIWLTIINHNNVPLALGRTQRLASRGQTMALIARDAGCSFPGCTHPPSWSDRHHIKDWIHRRKHRSRQFDAALPVSPHPLPAKRLDLPHERRWTTGMDTTLVDRPTAATPTQHQNPTPPRPTTTR